MAPVAAERRRPLDARAVAVVGAGRMGTSIAEWLAFSGMSVTLCSRNPGHLSSFRHRIEKHFAGKARRGRLSESEASEALERVRTAQSYDGLTDVGFVIECVVEDLDVKRALFQELSREVSPQTVLCSNTSSLSISELGGEGSDAPRVVGTHFFQPVRFTRVVEVVRGEATSTETTSRVDALLRETGKVPIHVRDCPGFLVNRMLGAYLIASARLACEEGESPARIDRVLREWGVQLGPFEVMKLVGIELVVAIARRLERAYGDRFVIGETLEKSGDSKAWLETLALDEEEASGRCADEEIVDRTVLPLVREALSCLREGVASEDDLELAAVECLRMPTGPIALARERGMDARDEDSRFLARPHRADRTAKATSSEAARGGGSHLEIERDRDVTVVTLNAPPRNALTRKLLEDFERVLDSVEVDGTRAMVITGAGRVFSTGVDLAELAAIGSAEQGRVGSRRGQDLLHRIASSSIPIVAAINGVCLGGGLELALACHFRFCEDQARLGLPEIQLGVIPGMGGTQRLPRLLGLSRALELILLGDTIKAERAIEIGLVDRLVARHAVLGEAFDFAQRIGSREPSLVAAVLRTVVGGLGLPLEAGLELEAETFGRLAATASDVVNRPESTGCDNEKRPREEGGGFNGG